MKKSKLQNTTTIDITGKRIIPNLYTSHAGDYLPGDILDANSTIDKISEAVATEITYAELKELRDNSNLVPGKYYRITDYVTTTMQDNTQSAGHQFDILVMATGKTTLSEHAFAVQHEGDEYFADSKLEAWELKYTPENVQWSKQKGTFCVEENDEYALTAAGTVVIDETEYILWKCSQEIVNDYEVAWAVSTDAEVGTELIGYDPETGELLADDWTSVIVSSKTVDADGVGTILWMKDEFGNECPYDFKNIQFKRWKVTDGMSGRTYLNDMYMCADLNNLAAGLSVEDETDFIWAYTFSSDMTGANDQEDYSLGGQNVCNNVIKPSKNGILNNNVFYGHLIQGNVLEVGAVFNSIGQNFLYNLIGTGFEYNSISYGFEGNSVANGARLNSIGYSFKFNTIGPSFGSNMISYNFTQVKTGANFFKNSITNDFINNSFGVNVRFIKITRSSTQYINVMDDVKGTSPSSMLTLDFQAGKEYTQVACKDSNGDLVIYVPGDLA